VIDVGQVLDKYELLERVGQGGMAIVYRGLDRSLQREVAVKVLHRHLSDHQEARDRFEREAHAVAKLRHENILEIFDYSGKTSDDSYIVTEFIEGQTLKEFITDHPPQFPEIGAMITVQICRALAHAHAQGILHRDVKPENVMIRTDGVVKLMDFGISQMIDTQRLTVTGQLLGSPAYMSPEHVEGRPLDFRTDVFAAGIVLYQLAVGKLPFEGKNPHEILKRIAECKYQDPRHASPRIGNELGRIILRSMARLPGDRYRDMGEMLSALERYLDGSGLGGVRDELARFFKAPAPYEMALKARLVDHLLRRARDCLAAGNSPVALEQLDRVLAIDPVNPHVTEILGRLGKKRRTRTFALIGVAVVAAGAGAWAVRTALTDSGSSPRAEVVPDAGPPDAGQIIATAPPDAAPDGPPPDAGRVVPAAPDANERVVVRPKIDAGVVLAAPDAGAAAVVRLTVSPPDSEVKIGDASWRTLPGGTADVTVPAGAEFVMVEARNEKCCESTSEKIRPEQNGKTVQMTLGFLPARITPTCDVADVTVTIDGKQGRLGRPSTISFGDTTQTQKHVAVEFVGKTIDRHELTVTYAEVKEVACKLE
jgi:eukaryotic-like serine/threonine-protein kinase